MHNALQSNASRVLAAPHLHLSTLSPIKNYLAIRDVATNNNNNNYYIFFSPPKPLSPHPKTSLILSAPITSASQTFSFFSAISSRVATIIKVPPPVIFGKEVSESFPDPKTDYSPVELDPPSSGTL
jgi:hypothetical protein